MIYISDILARQILDSRGNPTLEVDVKLSDGSLGRAAVPSGASTGEYEAYELRDNNLKLFNGKSVLKAIENINVEIFNTFSGRNPYQQRIIDRDLIDLDGTANKNKLGANAILGFSMAVAIAAAKSQNLRIDSGDVVLFHTGWTDAKLQSDPLEWGSGMPGITADLAEYLASKKVIADGADIENAGYEQGYYQDLTINATNSAVTSGKVVMAFIQPDGATGDFYIKVSVKYKLN